MFGGGEACLDVVIVEDDFIIAGRGFFGGMAVTGTVAAVRSGLRAGVQLDIAGGRHHEHIAKVGMAGAAEMRVAETHNGAVFVLVAGTVFIDSGLVTLVHVMGNCVGVGAELHDAERCTQELERNQRMHSVAELHDAERCTRSGKSVPHAVGANDGVDVLDESIGREDVVLMAFFCWLAGN